VEHEHRAAHEDHCQQGTTPLRDPGSFGKSGGCTRRAVDTNHDALAHHVLQATSH
jgi:hypothetical protein